ncbi:hypothetical protein [Sphingomonas rubra]|uniref:Uncharacterized protein n=1 Tax=Sphingomonas rubra TaxID=634430 RepID=A0A1I5U2W0_9SPHN|nr:hypothetical protein [Sphingomonas rubra]SFP89197.1 hypothetical protein SAMN04488241_11031 [Sphingomonas rubra]
MSLLLMILAQVAAPATPPQRISILARQCPDPVGGEVVVCGKNDAPRLPLPDERREPGEIVHHKGQASLDNGAGRCAVAGCQVGVDLFGMATAAARLVGKVVDPNSCCDEPGQGTSPGLLLRDVAGAFRKKPDKSNRVAIDLDAPPPPLAGRLSP